MNRRPRVCFLMDQIAGHVSNYRNLRSIVDEDGSLDATWCEIVFDRPEQRFERTARALKVVPPYVIGVLRGATELRRGLRQGGPFDAVYCNSSVAVTALRPLHRRPTMLNLDSTPLQLDSMPEYPGPRDPRLVAYTKRKATTRLFTGVARIQAWSSWARASFIDDYGVEPANVRVNPPGISLDFWRPPAGRPAGNPVRVLFVGGDFQRKGGDLLLDWAARRADRAELHVVTRDPVPALAGVVVHRDLHPNTPELLALYHGADVFAMPSLAECFGIATVEAMATGLPVVASDAGGTADIVDDGNSGFICCAGKQGALDVALDRLVEDAALRQRMGAAGLDRARQRFDVRITAQRTIADLHELTGSR